MDFVTADSVCVEMWIMCASNVSCKMFQQVGFARNVDCVYIKCEETYPTDVI